MINISNKVKKIGNNTDLYLKNIFLKQNINSNLIKPMKYSVFSGGKRLRSSIVVNTGKIFNINYRKLIIIGAAVECIHAYSLIHDDLPSMDNDEFRRGKPTTHKKFNEFTAILAGNSLLTLAFEILSGKDLNITEKHKNELIRALSICSGHLGLAGGQYYDLTFEKKKYQSKILLICKKKRLVSYLVFAVKALALLKE